MTIVLIVAAGRGYRLGGPVPKQYRLLDDIPIIRHTVSAFQRHKAIASIRVVIHPSDLTLYRHALDGVDLPPPLIGGETRQESVRLGLEGIADAAPDTVIIHDAVRPFVAQATIGAVIGALGRAAGAIAGVPLTDTLKRCAGDRVIGTVERTDLWRAQTPQAFRYADILAAHRGAYRDDPMAQTLTDDCAVAERAGLDVEMVHASDDNFKITTEDDLRRAEFMIRHRAIQD